MSERPRKDDGKFASGTVSIGAGGNGGSDGGGSGLVWLAPTGTPIAGPAPSSSLLDMKRISYQFSGVQLVMARPIDAMRTAMIFKVDAEIVVGVAFVSTMNFKMGGSPMFGDSSFEIKCNWEWYAMVPKGENPELFLQDRLQQNQWRYANNDAVQSGPKAEPAPPPKPAENSNTVARRFSGLDIDER